MPSSNSIGPYPSASSSSRARSASTLVWKRASSTRAISLPPLPGDNLAGGDFVGAGCPPEDRVAVRKAAEALDDVVMLLRVAEQIIVAERGEQGDRAPLVGEVLAMLERHVEEA